MIRESIERLIINERLSIIQWETLAAQISNSINNMPIALSSHVTELENADLITPNRLRHGRNNERSPVEAMSVNNDPNKMISRNKEIFNTWFEAWLITYVPKLMEHPKWYVSDRDLKLGDVIMFLKSEKEINHDYQYGLINAIHSSKDNKTRKVSVKYRNSNENIDRFTTRSAREIIVIHPVDELNLIQELGKIAISVDMKMQCQD